MPVWCWLLVVALLSGAARSQVDLVEEVRAALQASAEANAPYVSISMLLMYAAQRNANPEALRTLLDAGANLEARDEFGRTPLMLAAARNSNPKVVQLLLDAGTDATATDQEGRRAIDYARENEHLLGTDAYWRLNDASFD